jgi:hypothetical protein
MRSTAARFGLLLGIVVAVPVFSGSPHAMAAVEGECTVTLNGVEWE